MNGIAQAGHGALWLFSLPASYLMGSLPSGWLAARWLRGIDIREHGSGSTGATNVLRVVGKPAALVVLLVDVLKGTAAILLAQALDVGPWWEVVAGLLALAGHIWPLWLKFHGGKAVATGFGILLGLSAPVGLACFGSFLLVLSWFRIVSLASLVAGLLLPVLMRLAEPETPAYLTLAVLTMLLLIWRHRSNIHRLLAGVEPRLGAKAPPSS